MSQFLKLRHDFAETSTLIILSQFSTLLLCVFRFTTNLTKLFDIVIFLKLDSVIFY